VNKILQTKIIGNKKRGRPHDEDLTNLCDSLETENECQFIA